MKTLLNIGFITLLSTFAIVGCSSKETTMSDSMGVSDSSMAASESTPPVTVADNSGSSANLGAASSGNGR